MMIALLMLACAHAPLAPPGAQCTQAENHRVHTVDGATIALHRHRGEGPPVLVVHGISANHRSWDLTPDRSLAAALQAQGFDAWLMDLRGHGLAHQTVDGHRQRAGWQMDDYGRHDISAAVDFIQEETGYRRLGYVGHSMGGMVAAMHNAFHGDDDFAAMVIVASPVDFTDPDPLLTLTHAMVSSTPFVRVIPTPFMGRLAAHTRRMPLHGDDLLWSQDNLAPDARSQALATLASPMTRREVQQLADFIAEARFPAAEHLSSLHVPLRVIAGRADRIAPADRVAAFHDLAGSLEKDFILAAKVNGFSHDYGHVDLVIGDQAAAEIYPLITGWFSGRW